MIKLILTLTAIGAAAISTSSCATFAGVGQDVQKLGSSVEKTAVRSSQR
jgi:predicted small secreted protein